MLSGSGQPSVGSQALQVMVPSSQTAWSRVGGVLQACKQQCLGHLNPEEKAPWREVKNRVAAQATQD